MQTTRHLRVSIFLLLTTAISATGEDSLPKHVTEFLVVKAETTLFGTLDGNLQPVVKLPKKSVLTTAVPTAAHRVPKYFAFVSFKHPAAGARLRGWVDCRDTMNLSSLLRQQAVPQTEKRPRFTWDEIPALVRLHNAKESWKEIQRIIKEAEEKNLNLPDAYLARAQLWARLHNHDEALKDYLMAARMARDAAPDGDLVTPARYFTILYDAISEHNVLPKPPGPGEADGHFGSGIHSFRDGNLDYAIKQFTDAIQLDSGIALYYYFRALTYRRLGKQDFAERDARTGSYYEARMPSLLRGRISHGLQNVQGPIRIWLEHFRLGDPHYDPRRDKSLPAEGSPRPEQ